MGEPGQVVMARFLGEENVDPGATFLEDLDPDFARYVNDFVDVRPARRQGATEEEIREVPRQVAVYAGFPSAWNALATMREALADANPERS